jgi:hypothetical protein
MLILDVKMWTSGQALADTVGLALMRPGIGRG